MSSPMNQLESSWWSPSPTTSELTWRAADDDRGKALCALLGLREVEDLPSMTMARRNTGMPRWMFAARPDGTPVYADLPDDLAKWPMALLKACPRLGIEGATLAPPYAMIVDSDGLVWGFVLNDVQTRWTWLHSDLVVQCGVTDPDFWDIRSQLAAADGAHVTIWSSFE